METFLRCRVSALSAFCRPTTQTSPSISNCLVAIVHKKQLIAILVPKLVTMATSLSTAGPSANTRFLWPIRAHNPNGIWICSAVFAQMTAECPYTLQWGTLPPPNCPFPWGSGPLSSTWFVGPTRVLNPKGISIGAAVFAGLTSVTDRSTDRPTDRHATRSITIDRIYVRSTAMRPNNN